MSLSLSLPTNIDFTSFKFERFTLCNSAPAPSKNRSDVRVSRAQLVCLSTGVERDVVCKLAYGHRSKMSVANEAHRRGSYVLHRPRLLGGIRSFVFGFTDVLHIRNRNVLNNDGFPMIIDFGEAEDHECERQMGFTENVAAPSVSDFGCTELFQLCIDLRIWKPGKFQYIRNSIRARLLYNPYRVAETAPKAWSYEAALDEAYRGIDEHLRKFYPEDFRRRPIQRSRSCASDKTSSSAGDGCTTDTPPSPSDSPTADTTTFMDKA
ncbi:hypothetical protein EVG20_g1793 [Dentipellis fragilis]|uniref:Uncharacterized protein n=1 Tax=Dentipellis fragilis TaxID=205917 RepID=A0A4Y9ZB57_9AGAM|nr:hypothetical protein EVG20_g1793 [Dentipellis fragilis]